MKYALLCSHDGVIKWKHFRVTGHLHGEFTGHRWFTRTKASDAELWSLISAWITGWVNNGKAGDLRRHRAHYYVTLMSPLCLLSCWDIRNPFVSYTRACETSARCLRSIYPSLGMKQLFGDVTNTTVFDIFVHIYMVWVFMDAMRYFTSLGMRQLFGDVTMGQWRHN